MHNAVRPPAGRDARRGARVSGAVWVVFKGMYGVRNPKPLSKNSALKKHGNEIKRKLCATELKSKEAL